MGGQARLVGLVSLPVTRASVNGFVLSDCLLDSGSQKSLIDSNVMRIIAPHVELHPATRLVSASGHPLKALGTCRLPIKIVAEGDNSEVDFPFTVVEELSHDCVFGWDFMQKNHVTLDCSDASGQLKIRIKKPVRIPPRSVSCLSVRIDKELCVDSDYVLTGQRSDQIDITDSLLRPFAPHEIPLYVRNRSDRFVTLHRRDVIGYLQPADGADISDVSPPPTDTDETDDNPAEVNGVSASDGQFLGQDADDILAQFEIGEEIKGTNRDKVAKLLRSFSDVFSKSYSDIGCYSGGEADLELKPGAKPQFVKPYPVPFAKEAALKQQLAELQASGIIAEGEPCEWNSPVILISKGGDKASDRPAEFRIIEDMRKVNQVLLPKKFVLPSIDDFLYSLQGWKIASSLDIKHAFWNLKLSKESQKICAFYALGKTWRPTRLPMGCSQSSFHLHVVMHRVLGNIPGVTIYADDVLLTSPDAEHHMRLLQTVLDKLRRAGFKLSPKKCRIGMNRLSYLGHEITPEGIAIDADRIRCIQELKPPATVKEAKRIYGFFAWFKKFLPSFSSVSAPLVRLANADRFYWDPELGHAFNTLRQTLLYGQVLAYPTREDRFVLYTDSSSVGSGQVLCQIQNGEEKVIAFNGSKYSKPQSKWTIYELELFSFVTGLKKFYKFLADAEFTWVCDCKSALKILQNKDEMNPRIIRWRAFVSQFHYQPEHRPASRMRHVDMISRIPEHYSETGRSDGDTDKVGPPTTFDSPVCGDAANPAHISSGLGETATVGMTESHSHAPRPVTRPGDVGKSNRRAADKSGGGGESNRRAADKSGGTRPSSDGRHHSDEPTLPPQTAPTHARDRATAQNVGRRRLSAADGRRHKPDAGAKVHLVAGVDLAKLSMDRCSIIWYQKHDKDCRAIAHHLKYHKWPKFCSPALKRQDINMFSMNDGILCYKGRQGTDTKIVWPRVKRFEILYANHDPSHHGHRGSDKLYQKISQHIWYVGLKRDCKNYVESCSLCSRRKDDRGPPSPPLLPQEPYGPGDILVVDIMHMTNSRSTGNSLVLTCVDKFTGFISHYPLQSGSADDLVEALTTQFVTFGPPLRVETDAGANFKSHKVATLCKFWGIKIRHAVGGHHEAVGKIERRHRDIKRRLRTLTESYGSDWESHMSAIIFSLNSEVSETHGFSPYFLYFMRHPNTPISHLVSQPSARYSDDFVQEKLRLLADTLRQAHDETRRTQADMKRTYDLRHRAREPTIRVGDRVRMRNPSRQPGVSRKMTEPWSPTYIVVSRLSRRHVEYLDPRTGVTRRTHLKYLKPVVERDV